MMTARSSTARALRGLGLGTAGVMALVLGAQPAFAAEADQPAQTAAAEPAEAIIVTGSRIARSGYDAPTPVNIVSEAELQAEPQPNIGDYVNTLPAVQGSLSSSTNSGSLSNGQAGLATVNLRNLGSNRTLVLIDGQRSVASATQGLVDIQTIPQGLIKGVEVVTGGASSAYGSDAVAGVVNFILNKDYEGFKAEYEHGVTTYGDVPNHVVRLTAGIPFAGGKGKILLSGDYFTQKGVDTYDRKFQNAGFFQIDNPAYVPGNGQPERFVGSGIGTYQFTPGGIVNSGPLRGTYFGSIGANGQASLNQFTYGPNKGQWMIGGDYLISREGHVSTNSLAPDEERINAFGRVSYEISPSFEIYGQMGYSRYEGQSFYQQTPSTGITIQRDNAFLPTAFRDLMVANSVTSVSIGTSNNGIPQQGSDNAREVFRYVLGADGDFATGGINWNYDAYYQLGIAKTRELLTNTWLTGRMALAQDAVFNGGGNIVCRSTLTNPTNGCVPLNRIGIGGVTDAALNYIFNDGAQPLRNQRLRQDVAAVTFQTNDIWDNWAGPVSLAFGAEYRREAVDGVVDPQFNSGWLYGNYRVTKGDFTVKEAFVETIFPLYEGLDLNGALRVTNYSTSGTVTTWKLGATWQVIDDLKFRVTRSRDIRAPNLNDLFAPGTARTNTVNVPDATVPGGRRADQFLEQTTGNIDLTPEVARTWGIGAVFTPTFLPGFAASVDYFDIKLADAIANINAQTTVDLCFEQNDQAQCGQIDLATPTDIRTITLVPFNFASVKTRGIDFEASYRAPVGPGNLTLRGVASHYIDNITDNGINAPIDIAGSNAGGGIPAWNYRLSANYDVQSWAINVVGRGFSGGVYSNNFIECQTTCGASTADFRTINNNRIAGQWYLDASLTKRFEIGRSKAEVFLYVRNLLNTDPVLVGNGPTGNNTPAYPQTNRGLYDVLGRVFRLGVRFEY